MSKDEGHKVELYIYDLSFGLSQQLSEIILGKFDHNLANVLDRNNENFHFRR